MDNPPAMVHVDGQNETWYYYFADALGSIRLLVHESGAIAESYAYDVYGRPRVMTGAGPDGNWLTEDTATQDVSAVGNPYLFTARRWDAATGLYHYRFRDYTPTLGRFLQTDPLGYIDGMNLYAYVNNNPLNWVDPWGLLVETGAAVTSSAATWGYMTANGTFISGGAVCGLAIGSAAAGAGIGYYGIYKPIAEPLLTKIGNRIGTTHGPTTATDIARKREQIEAARAKRPRPPSLPMQGEPNTSLVRDNGDGTGQIRDYGQDGRPTTDYDFGHDHGHGDPHQHRWDGDHRGRPESISVIPPKSK